MFLISFFFSTSQLDTELDKGFVEDSEDDDVEDGPSEEQSPPEQQPIRQDFKIGDYVLVTLEGRRKQLQTFYAVVSLYVQNIVCSKTLTEQLKEILIYSV